MSSPAKAHEPTMEEILASIRRIISDDEPSPLKAAPKPLAEAEPMKPKQAPEPAAADLGQDDIDAMFAAMDAPAPAPEPESNAAPRPTPTSSPPVVLNDDLDVLELTEDFSAEPEPAPQARSAPPPPPPVVSPPAPRDDRLLSQRTDESVQAAFGNLNTIMAGSARTLDDIVREMLRPMLKTWLDDNLPPLVERLVRQEIERVARGGR
jgi:cell pole-organizing protein PopZ